MQLLQLMQHTHTSHVAITLYRVDSLSNFLIDPSTWNRSRHFLPAFLPSVFPLASSLTSRATCYGVSTCELPAKGADTWIERDAKSIVYCPSNTFTCVRMSYRRRIMKSNVRQEIDSSLIRHVTLLQSCSLQHYINLMACYRSRKLWFGKVYARGSN